MDPQMVPFRIEQPESAEDKAMFDTTVLHGGAVVFLVDVSSHHRLSSIRSALAHKRKLGRP
jgi:hypothetical protein